MSIDKITKSDYEDWKNDEVTQRFFAELEANHAEAEKEFIYGANEFEVNRAAHMRNASLTVFQKILDWKPTELENDE